MIKYNFEKLLSDVEVEVDFSNENNEGIVDVEKTIYEIILMVNLVLRETEKRYLKGLTLEERRETITQLKQLVASVLLDERLMVG